MHFVFAFEFLARISVLQPTTSEGTNFNNQYIFSKIYSLWFEFPNFRILILVQQNPAKKFSKYNLCIGSFALAFLRFRI